MKSSSKSFVKKSQEFCGAQLGKVIKGVVETVRMVTHKKGGGNITRKKTFPYAKAITESCLLLGM